jgi:outer membrane receptor protein involved in Fe transport
MNRSKLWAVGLGSAAALLVLSVAPAPVYAQEGADEDEEVLEEIVTTGSRIRRDDFSSSSPLTVVGGLSILEQGVSNLGEALRDQPSIGSGGFNQTSILSGGGASSIDLRNLGQDRVLVLINGRRVASFADALQNQAADLSFVPTAMVDRVEILRDGASAVYGSDAITGVVNVILKKDFEGIEMSLNTGTSAESDGEGYGFAITMGASNDRGSFVAGAEYRRQDAVKQVDRGWAFPAISSLNSGGAVNGSFYSTGGLFWSDNDNIFCTQPLAFGGNEIDDISGVDGAGCPSFAPRQNVSSPDQVQLLRYDYGLAQDLIVPNEVITTSVFGNYDLNDNVNVFLEMQYSRRDGTTHLDGNPGAFYVPDTNPNLPVAGDGGFMYVRPATTIGPRTQDYASATYRVVAGLEGDLPIGENWGYEASILYTSVDADLVTNSVWNVVRAERISDPDLCALDALCSNAVNPSGALDAARPGNWTDQEIRYMRQGAQAVSKFDLVSAQAFISGSLFELPAGDVGMAFGIETRRETGYAKPDSVTEGGESIANQTYTTNGAYETDEAFIEFDVPLVSDAPGFQDLTLNLQYRFTDYDTFGSDDAWRAGLNWQITDWVRVRGNVSTAYRAPSVTDLFSGGVQSFDFFTDICEAAVSGITPADNAWQNCVLDGIDPATFSQFSSQYPVIAGGNPLLDPETADTVTYGIVFTPGGALEGLQVSLDVWDIEVTNLIGRGSSDETLDACYEGPVGLTAYECTLFAGRNQVGIPIDFQNGTTNFADELLETNGIDLGINYAFDAGSTSWNVALNSTFTDENTFYSETPSASDRGSQPDVQINTRLDMFLNDWTFSWLTRYIGEMNDTRFDGTNSFGYDVVDSYFKHDLRVAYDWERYRFVFGINNALDEDPPYVFASGINTDGFLYDVFGRYWFARVTFSM